MSKLLANVPGLTPAPVTPGADHAFWLYPVRVQASEMQRIAAELDAAKVPVFVGYTGKPIYLCAESLSAKKTYGQSGFPFTIREGTKTYEYREGLCPRAEKLLTQLLCIIWDESWTDAEVERVAAAIARSVGKAGAVAASPAPAVARIKKEEAASVRPIAGARKTRIGIVGCGHMGGVHLRAYRDNPAVELVAFADTKLENAQRFASEVGGNAYASHVEMLAREKLDGVSLCTVPSTHRDIAVELLSRGVHVLCEKPLAVSEEEAGQMARKALDQKRLLVPAFKLRFNDEVREAKKLIEQGGLGQILTFRLMFADDDPARGGWSADSGGRRGGRSRRGDACRRRGVIRRG